MGLSIYQVDSFTDRPFSGNPAAVCRLVKPVDERWMQNVAKEMNLSESAFLRQEEDGYSLRWFTPTREVDLCGHATLASAHILWERNYLPAEEEARFHTRSGLLTARKAANGYIELNFPLERDRPADPPKGLLEALGVQAEYVGKNRFDYIVEVSSEEIVRSLNPDFRVLSRLPCEGVIVTGISASEEQDFVSRYFAPGLGINEDPVTGSAHCCLAPYWQKRLNKDQFVARQLSERGGRLTVRLSDQRVHIGGQAVTVFKGELSERTLQEECSS
ncbi:Phenazine biosynthesis PhzF protein [Acididesulfobacillus acetoxydans]|uniref:Phenazine biosynthesis PhzF protein n=1 Tax=Acididesulfobacillus acetoxydans TaxID=1561005 RepID=A0A8S0W8R7_9FIRM|nr:PhzF family phenazine biosynthesis protein [Acididesulfobacillus acetoxydans]CAA7602019.1 Phenazine biosynthesis PhzF protein [Acididesulfobacillus acetoxydans]CEJ08138.1 Phenazine biosynthesis-like domain-containing protein [Acididesulfobacillus acetoxydans]